MSQRPANWRQSGLHLWWLMLLIVIADQLTKIWVAGAIPLYERVDVLPFFDLVHARNYGAAFSFLHDAGGWQRWFFTTLALVISGVLLYLLRRQPRQLWRPCLAFSLIVGGAIGNVADRIRLGYVVDFLDFYYQGWHWPAFNVADAAIVCGALLLVLDGVLEARQERKAKL